MSYTMSMILLFATMIFAMVAQGKVKTTFAKYLKIQAMSGMTGADAARRLLERNGLSDVSIQRTPGVLSDRYDPRNRVMYLSDDVYFGSSIGAVSVACHETGHAIQHSRNYVPLKLRNAIVPITSFASRAIWPLIFIGFFLMYYRGDALGAMLFDVGIIAMLAVVAFHLVTLPVELDASNRAIEEMLAEGVILPEEKSGAKQVLKAAAMTYIAALAVSMANLFRLLAIRGNR